VLQETEAGVSVSVSVANFIFMVLQKDAVEKIWFSGWRSSYRNIFGNLSYDGDI
jgi:hypothetical protein